MNWTLLGNSLAVATLTSILALILGLSAALLTMALTRHLRITLLTLAALTLVLPPFLVANSWIHLLTATGTWRPGLPVNIHSLAGTVTLLSLLLWPIPLFLILGAWQRLELPQLESEPLLTGHVLILRLLLPMAHNAVGTAIVIVFVLALNNFAIPALLQVRVYPAEVWISFNTHLDAAAAFRSSWPLIIAPLLLIIWFRRRQVQWPASNGPIPPHSFKLHLGSTYFFLSATLTLLTLLLALAFPLGDLLADPRTWREWSSAIRAGHIAISNSFLFASISATLVALLGVLAWRHHPGPCLWFPFLIPGVLLGLALIVIFNRSPFLPFYRGTGIVLLAFTLRYLAIGWSGIAHAMRSVDTNLIDAARLDGASPWQIFRRVSFPQAGPWIAASWFIVYLLCLWDVETLVLIAPPGAETLAGRIFGFLHYGHNAQVNALCLSLLTLAILPLLFWITWRLTTHPRHDAIP
jgi:iron(III) transport system permease protein